MFTLIVVLVFLSQVLVFVKGILSSWDVTDRLINKLCSLWIFSFVSETLSINKS